MPRQIFQLRVELAEVRPPVWRRLLVPGGYTLDRLHRVLQHGLGWRDCHLHCFEIGGVQFGVPDPDGEPELRDELDTRLDAVLDLGSRFRYLYDFGDWWEHDLLLEEIQPADPDERYPSCVDGERACPPESVGGPYGYRGFLAALADPAHLEHETMRAWIGRPFDPAEFHPDRASTLLRRFC